MGRRSGEGCGRRGGTSGSRSAAREHPPPPGAFHGTSGSRGVGGAGGSVARGLGPLRAAGGSARGGAVEPGRLPTAHRSQSCAPRGAHPAEGTRTGRGDFGGAGRPCSCATGAGGPCRACHPHRPCTGPAFNARGACRADPRACTILCPCRLRFVRWDARRPRSGPFASCHRAFQGPSGSVRRRAVPGSALLPRPARRRAPGVRGGAAPTLEALSGSRERRSGATSPARPRSSSTEPEEELACRRQAFRPRERTQVRQPRPQSLNPRDNGLP